MESRGVELRVSPCHRYGMGMQNTGRPLGTFDTEAYLESTVCSRGIRTESEHGAERVRAFDVLVLV